ncbi:MAG: hypothetical protein LBB90_07075 [Tannerella sp.]|jgi:hypothetical protein|nr:hypothetical protein [Tannerella sp.]
MNQQTRSIIFAVSGTLVLTGAILYLGKGMLAPYLFAAGAAGVTVCYLTVPSPPSDNFRVRRLNRWNSLAGLAMIVASVFMFRHRMEWVAFLLISALIQIYTAFVPTDKP